MRGINEHEILDIARYFRERGHTVRFIEFMDVGTLNRWSPEGVVSASEIVARIAAELPLEAVPRSNPSDPASRYRYLDGSGEVGVIASITQPFCGDCSRARLTSEGRLLTCLFAESGLDLKVMMRGGASDEELLEAIRRQWQGRGDRYSEQRAELMALGRGEQPRRVEMFRVGG
jgi:cyclic pyranopterin phosphate synthase